MFALKLLRGNPKPAIKLFISVFAYCVNSEARLRFISICHDDDSKGRFSGTSAPLGPLQSVSQSDLAQTSLTP